MVNILTTKEGRKDGREGWRKEGRKEEEGKKGRRREGRKKRS